MSQNKLRAQHTKPIWALYLKTLELLSTIKYTIKNNFEFVQISSCFVVPLIKFLLAFIHFYTVFDCVCHLPLLNLLSSLPRIIFFSKCFPPTFLYIHLFLCLIFLPIFTVELFLTISALPSWPLRSHSLPLSTPVLQLFLSDLNSVCSSRRKLTNDTPPPQRLALNLSVKISKEDNVSDSKTTDLYQISLLAGRKHIY